MRLRFAMLALAAISTSASALDVPVCSIQVGTTHGVPSVVAAICDQSPLRAPTAYRWTGLCNGISADSQCFIRGTGTVTVAGINAAGIGPAASVTITPPVVVVPMVIEFYNALLDHYFITANDAEASAIDNGSAGPGWSRTGMRFKVGGSSSVCRFYGSQLPGPNSHFYTINVDECTRLIELKAVIPDTQKRWNFESLNFSSTAPLKPAAGDLYCAANTQPVYRAYNNGFAKGIDSNHRITTDLSAIAAVVARGWIDEGIVMCAPQ